MGTQDDQDRLAAYATQQQRIQFLALHRRINNNPKLVAGTNCYGSHPALSHKIDTNRGCSYVNSLIDVRDDIHEYREKTRSIHIGHKSMKQRIKFDTPAVLKHVERHRPSVGEVKVTFSYDPSAWSLKFNRSRTKGGVIKLCCSWSWLYGTKRKILDKCEWQDGIIIHSKAAGMMDDLPVRHVRYIKILPDGEKEYNAYWTNNPMCKTYVLAPTIMKLRLYKNNQIAQMISKELLSCQ